MRVARRTFLASTLASLAAPAVMRSARADAPPIALKLHHSFSAVSCVHDRFLAPWARQIAAESGGRLRVDVFPSMQLGGAPAHLFDQARDGAADIVWAVPGLTPGRFPKIATFELPFLPSRRALVSSKALQDFAALYLRDEFDEVRPLAFSCADRGVIHAINPVRTIEDINGLKLHVQTELAGEAVRALGAHPVPMPSAQLPVAITERVVDGAVDPWHMVPPLRLNDLLKTHTEFSDVSLSSRTYVLAMNKAAYDRLPRDLKTVLDNNSGELVAGMAGAMWDLQAQAVAEDVAERGGVIVTLLPEAVAHWRRRTEPVIGAWLKGMKENKLDGGKMIASAHALLAKYANVPEPQPPRPRPLEPEAASEPPPRSAGVTTVPKVDVPAAPSAAAKPFPTVPPAATAAPAVPAPQPHIATQAPAPRLAAPITPPPAAAPAAPVAAPVAPPPPAPTPVPPPKTLNIPL